MYSVNQIDALLARIYSDTGKEREAIHKVHDVIDRNLPTLERGQSFEDSGPARLTEQDVFLITYGNTLTEREGEAPLAVLRKFCDERLSGIISYIHILPFFPYSSDDGFSIIDYRKVNPELGDWKNIRELGRNFKLAFDLVVNHASSQSEWFQGFLRGDPNYDGWFLTRPDGYDSSSVVRPRTHPLLSVYKRPDGTSVNVWTTFSYDQVDLDFSNPAVLAEMLDVFLGYVAHGARIIRMDAIAYLWKEDGHPCLHHPKTHAVVKLFRAVVDALGLNVLILTETNVPHEQNLSYFGSEDEAHMVYNFALPPLVLHSFVAGNVECLSAWARELRAPVGGSFLNFLASHDGIGLTPASGLVDDEDFKKTISTAVERGGLISYKAAASGSIPYELNASWFDVVSDPALPEDLRVRAHLASHAVAASLDGMPAVYIHSILGTGNWIEGPALRGYNRAINRRILDIRDVENEMKDDGSRVSRVLNGMCALYTHRGEEPALAPGSPSRVLSREGAVFAVLRGAPERSLLCLVNASPHPATFDIGTEVKLAGAPYDPTTEDGQGKSAARTETGMRLEPYGVLWAACTSP